VKKCSKKWQWKMLRPPRFCPLEEWALMTHFQR